MNIKLSFLGAARNVTGSCYCVEANGTRLLVDCGLYQERELRGRNWAPFTVPPDSLDAVLLTHAHLDHSGLTPRMMQQGFKGRIYCTRATADIARIMLMDSANIQEEDAEFKKRRHEREGRKGPYPEIPLYTTEDARSCCELLSPVGYNETVEVGKGITATFHDAGHVFGSAMVSLSIRQNGESRRIIFSGDVGRWNAPILRDPTVFNEADYVLVESTYGDRLHADQDTAANQLADIINQVIHNHGNILVPSFALERAQEVLYYLNQLLLERRIPPIMVFLDSPMAANITDVFVKYPELYDRDMKQLMREGNSPFDLPGLTVVRRKEQSKAINNITGGTMIIAGSGMCTGGRIKHHLVNNISRPECTVLFVGYQAVGTLGRHIVDGASEVRILGQMYPVRARIEQIQGFSAHADRDGLLRWLRGLRKPPRRVFMVHGEPEVIDAFARQVGEDPGWETSVPEYRQEVILN